jgi:hypothetical protein
MRVIAIPSANQICQGKTSEDLPDRFVSTSAKKQRKKRKKEY